MLRMLQMLPPVTPWFGLSHYYFFVDYMIIYDVDYIRRWVERQPIPPRCFISFESPRTRVPGIVSLDERA